MTLELSEIKININFENLIPKQTAEQFKQLEENMVSEGRARNPLVLWRGTNTLVDGHHRLKILKAHPELKWSVVEQNFTDEKVEPELIIRAGKASAATGYNKYAREILNIYNKHTTVGRLPDKLM